MIPSFRQKIASSVLAAVPVAMIGAILAGNGQETSIAGTLAVAVPVLAIASTVWSVAMQLARGAVIGAIAVGVAVLFAVWFYLASWTVSTGFGADPDCVRAGFVGPPMYERHIFPTSLWCTSADGANRVLMTPVAASVGWTVVGATLVAAAIAVAIGSLIRRHATSGGRAED